jgi:hypothetical protein
MDFMDMTRDALEFVVGLKAPTFHTDEKGREWGDRKLYEVKPDMPGAVEVSTLGGFCDLITNKIEGFPADGVLAHVVSFEHVSLIAKDSDIWGRRQIYVTSHLLETRGFPFGTFHDHETFLIGVLAHFTQTEDRDYLVSIASHIASEKVRTSLDDGIAQEATLKQGASLKTTVALRNRLKLAPFRTFREVDQPVSEFLFRLRGGNETTPPTLALFEADGGKWQIDAMEIIGRYLRTSAPDIPVVI